MSVSNHSTILRRMIGKRADDTAVMPVTSARAVRLALTKAANDAAGLVLTVQSLEDEVMALDQVLDGLDTDQMLTALERDDKLAGVVAIDVQLRAAVLEMQTMGKLLPVKAEPRKDTGTDKRMCDPVIAGFLGAMPAATLGTRLEAWTDGAKIGERIDSPRAAGLLLDDRDYRVMRLTVDLGVAERQGQMVVVLPLVDIKPAVPVAPVVTKDWHAQFGKAVATAPAELDAVLHRMSLPLGMARSLQVGQVLPLLGCTVHSVKLETRDGKVVAQAKLGQFGGMRAVRIEDAPAVHMSDLSTGGAGYGSAPADDRALLGMDDGGMDMMSADAMPMDDDDLMAGAAMMQDLPDDLSLPTEADGENEDASAMMPMAAMDFDADA